MPIYVEWLNAATAWLATTPLGDDAFVCLLAFVLGGFVKGAAGFGLPLVATPILLFAVTVPEAVVMLICSVLASNMIQAFQARQGWRIIRLFWPMVLANAVILMFGASVLVSTDARLLTSLVGVMILLSAIAALVPSVSGRLYQLVPLSAKRMILPAGILSGIIGSSTSIFGFPSLQVIMLNATLLQLDKHSIAFAFAIMLASGHVSLWQGIIGGGYEMGGMIWVSLLLVVPMAVGLVLGISLRDRLSLVAFRRLVHGCLAVAGGSLLIKTLLF